MLVDSVVEAPNEIEAIVGGYHGDAFRFLGPHALTDAADGGERWVVRAFLPHASSVEVLVDGEALPMEKRHAHGFFVAYIRFGTSRLPAETAVCGTAMSSFIDDPYRFPPLLSDFDLYLHGEGTHYESYNTLGAHIVESLGVTGVRFAVWAPNAEVVWSSAISTTGTRAGIRCALRNGGIWEIFIPGIGAGMPYKYYVRSRHLGHRQLKADPYGFACEVPPKSASVVVGSRRRHEWNDEEWMEQRARNATG